MRRVALLVGFTLAICFPVALATCVVPGNLTEVDWHSMACGQTWYLTMSTDDPVSRHISCELTTRIHKHGNHVINEGIQFSKEYKATDYKGFMVEQPSGHYRFSNQSDMAESLYGLEHDATGHLDQEAVDEINLMFSEDVFMISDSKTYLCTVFCSPQHEWNVYVYTTSAEPKLTDVIAALTDLRAHGIHAKLHFADCRGALEHYCQICH